MEFFIDSADIEAIRELCSRLLAVGVPAITVNPDTIRDMVAHPGTAIAIDEFCANWESAYGRVTL